MSGQPTLQEQDIIYDKVVSACDNNSVSALLQSEPSICSEYNNEGETVFLTACKKNNLQVTSSLLQCYPPCLNQISQNGDTPLHMAAMGNAKQVAEWLLQQQNVVTDSTNKDGYTPLHIGCEFDHVDVVSLLLNHSKQNSTTSNTTTPLHRAALFGCLDVAKLLISSGYDVNALDESDNTALHCASRGCNMEFAAWLLSIGADVSIANKENSTAEEVAASQTVKELFQHHAKGGDALEFAKFHMNSEEFALQQSVHSRIQEEEYEQLVKRAEAELECELALLNEEKWARRIYKTADDAQEDEVAPTEDNAEHFDEVNEVDNSDDVHSDSGSDFSDESVLSGASTATYIMPDDYCSEISDALTPLNLPGMDEMNEQVVEALIESPRSQVSDDHSLPHIRTSSEDLSSASKRVLPLVRSHSTISAEQDENSASLPTIFDSLRPLAGGVVPEKMAGTYLTAIEINGDHVVSPQRSDTVVLDYKELYDIAKRGSVLNPIYDVDDSETNEDKRQVSADVEYEEVYETQPEIVNDDAAPATPTPTTRSASPAPASSSRGMSKERSKRLLIVEKDPTQWRNLLQGFDRDDAQNREITPQWRDVLTSLDAPVRRNSADMRGSVEWRSLLKSIDDKKALEEEEASADIDVESSELDDSRMQQLEEEESANSIAAGTDVAVAASDASDMDTIPTVSRASSVSAMSESAQQRPSHISLSPRLLRHMNSLDVFRTELPNDAFTTINRLQLVNSPMYEDIRVEYLDAVVANLETVFVRRESTSDSSVSSHHSEEGAEAVLDTPETANVQNDTPLDAVVADIVVAEPDSTHPEAMAEDDDIETHDDYFAAHFESHSSGTDTDDNESSIESDSAPANDATEELVITPSNESEEVESATTSCYDYDAKDVSGGLPEGEQEEITQVETTPTVPDVVSGESIQVIVAEDKEETSDDFVVAEDSSVIRNALAEANVVVVDACDPDEITAENKNAEATDAIDVTAENDNNSDYAEAVDIVDMNAESDSEKPIDTVDINGESDNEEAIEAVVVSAENNNSDSVEAAEERNHAEIDSTEIVATLDLADDSNDDASDHIDDIAPLSTPHHSVGQDNIWNASPRRLTFITPKPEIQREAESLPVSEPEVEPGPQPITEPMPEPVVQPVLSATPPVHTKQPKTPHVDRRKEKQTTQLPTPPGHDRARPHYCTPTAASTMRSRKANDSAENHSRSTGSHEVERTHSVPPKKTPPAEKQKQSPRSKSEPPPQRKKRITGFSDNHFIPVYEKPSYKNVSSRLFKPTESYLNSCWRGDVSKKNGSKDISPTKSPSKRTPPRKGATPTRQPKGVSPPHRRASPVSARSDISSKDNVDHSSNPEETSPRRHSASDYSNVKSRLYTPTEAFVNGRWVAQFEQQRKSFPSPELKVHVSDRLLKPTTATLCGQWKGSPKSPNDDDVFRLPTLSNPRQYEHVESRLLNPTVASTHWRWDHEHPSPEHHPEHHGGHWWDKVPTTAEMLHEEGMDSPRYIPQGSSTAVVSHGHTDDYFLMDVESTSNHSEQSTY